MTYTPNVIAPPDPPLVTEWAVSYDTADGRQHDGPFPTMGEARAHAVAQRDLGATDVRVRWRYASPWRDAPGVTV